MEMLERPAFIPIADNSAVDYLVGILHDAHVTTLSRIDGVTQQEFDWVYAEGWNTVGALVAHITSLKHLFRVEVIEQRRWSAEEREQWGPGLALGAFVPSLRGVPLDERVHQMVEAQELLTAGVRGMSVDDFARERSDPGGLGRYNAAWALYHAAEDEVHHRGQISILRKLYATLNETG